jgi:large subunit ribosomal protein L17
MRHSRVINHLGRTSSHRKAMLANMASSLIMHKRITTTTVKAKALKTFVEPLITKSKEDSTHSRRVVFSYLKDKTAVSELFREISPKVGDRPGGYTRILKIGNRLGDNAEMCILELVDYNETMLGGGEAAKGKTTRRRRSSKKKTEAVVPGKTEKKVGAKPVDEKSKKTEEPASETAETTEDSGTEEEK